MSNENQTSQLVLVEKEKEKLLKSEERFFQIDLLKTLMIFLVIFDHVVSWGIKGEIGVALWERICIPVFLVIMGFNMGVSFQRKGALSLRTLYSWSYFKSKILRYIVPFLILYGFSTLIGLIVYGFDITAMWHFQYYPNHGFIQLFTGILPFWGPGNWFIPVIFGSILLFPLLYWAFTKKPILTLILCFVVEIALQLIVFLLIGQITSWEEIYILNLFMTSFPFYLSAIGLGLWLSFNRKPFTKRNIFLWVLFSISLTYLILYQFFNFRFRINGVPFIRGDYNFLVFPYSAVLVLFAIMVLPKKSNNKLSRAISLISNSTYHILLTQIFGYGLIFSVRGTHYLIDTGFTFLEVLYLIYGWIIFISFGVIWYKFDQEKKLLRRILYYVNFFLIFAILVHFMYNMVNITVNPPRLEWMPLPMVLILTYGGVALVLTLFFKIHFRTTTLALWTSFLVYLFFVTILYIAILPPTIFIIPNLSIAVFLIFVIIRTILDYTFRK
ncbi:MAG: acyltransferase family protein [Candidatus Thorarchaeota archaeon]